MEASKVIVYTGSFNPVTKGHLMVMEEAIKRVNADKGLFVITSDKYLNYKMLFKTEKPTSFLLNEDVRREMIESLSKQNDKISFGGLEVGGASPSTLKTLNRVIKKYKDSEVYYLIGADKLHNLPRWNDADEIISKVKIIVAVRKGIDIETEIGKNEWLNKYKDRFIVINPDPSAFEISSSEIRRRFFNMENYADLMDMGPYNIMKQFTIKDFPEITPEEFIKYNYLYNGRFGHNIARTLLFKRNSEIFNNWDESLLGNKENMLANTKVYKEEFNIHLNNGYTTITDCVNADCADVALELLNEGYNPAILNLASNVSPGGGYHKGTNAQEECLCQMSTLSQSLYQFGSIKYKHIRDAKLPNYPDVYPMDINYGGLYSPNITFFRHNESKYYALRDKVFTCPIITVASLSNREKNDYTNDERKYFNTDGTLTEDGRKIEANKIRTIYRIALANGHDSIVLGAFGCGVYNLLPSEVSRLFYDILNEPEFKGNFKKIVFAILETQKRGKVVGSLGKFKPFYELFK